MTCITIGYGIAYTCRLGLSVVKKPLIDAGIFSADELGMIAILGIFYFGQDQRLTDETAVKRAVDNTVDWVCILALEYRFHQSALVVLA